MLTTNFTQEELHQMRKDHLKTMQMLIDDYEELKDIPNVNIISSIASKYLVCYICTPDEHSEHLGI